MYPSCSWPLRELRSLIFHLGVSPPVSAAEICAVPKSNFAFGAASGCCCRHRRRQTMQPTPQTRQAKSRSDAHESERAKLAVNQHMRDAPWDANAGLIPPPRFPPPRNADLRNCSFQLGSGIRCWKRWRSWANRTTRHI